MCIYIYICMYLSLSLSQYNANNTNNRNSFNSHIGTRVYIRTYITLYVCIPLACRPSLARTGRPDSAWHTRRAGPPVLLSWQGGGNIQSPAEFYRHPGQSLNLGNAVIVFKTFRADALEQVERGQERRTSRHLSTLL